MYGFFNSEILHVRPMLFLSKTNIFIWGRLPGNGVRMGVRGLAPGKFFETAPSRMTENSIFLLNLKAQSRALKVHFTR